jgi:hypothetical protein
MNDCVAAKDDDGGIRSKERFTVSACASMEWIAVIDQEIDEIWGSCAGWIACRDRAGG